MASLRSFLNFALLWTSAACTPTAFPVLNDLALRQTFSLEEVGVQRQAPWSAHREILKAYLKYGIEPPAGIQAAIRNFGNLSDNRTSTSVEATSIRGDIEYLLKVRVGNQTLNLDLDTGSADLWVFSTLLPINQRSARPQARVYDPNTSGAKSLEGQSWKIRYGDGSSAGGQVYTDNVSIGDITVPNQAVEAASTVSGTFSRDLSNDGLLGLAFSKLNTIKPKAQLTWFDNIKPKLAAPVFTAALKRHKPGTYDFGFIDRAKYKGEIVWVNVGGNRGFWDFNISGFAVGDGRSQIPQGGPINGIVDTGTSLWYVPSDVADAYWSTVESADNELIGNWVFSCKETLPDITVIIGGKKITIPGINMNYQTIGTTGLCLGGIQEATSGIPAIAGDVFLKNLFVAFESPVGAQARLGFAQT